MRRIFRGLTIAGVEGRKARSTFIDVIRQFAVPWRANDLPPSGAQDHEWILRDLILGIELPAYELHVRSSSPP